MLVVNSRLTPGIIRSFFLQPVHPHLHFISHLQSNVFGEQLLSQLFRLVPDHQWLFQYGRVPLSFILSDYVWTVRLYRFSISSPSE